VYAEEGTKCHDIVAKHLEKRNFTLDPKSMVIFPEEDRVELAQAIQDCLDFAFTVISDEGTNVVIEKQVTLDKFVEPYDCPHLNQVYGTADLIVQNLEKRYLRIIDWKFGKGIEVFPTSHQLHAYGVGALQSIESAARYDKVYLHIGQPRLYMGETFKVHESTPDELLSWAQHTLVPSLLDCTSINPTFNPSEEACRWCSVKATCPARFEQAQRTAQEVFAVHAALPNIVSIDDLADFLERSRDLTSYIKDIEFHIVNTIKSGKLVKGLKLVEGRSIRQWADEKQFFNWAQENHPDAEIFTQKLISPSQAERLFKRAVAKTEEFQALIVKPLGKPTLVPEDDKRPAIKYADAGQIFADYVEEDI